MNKVLIITGPTGVGKTDLSIDMAQKLSGEIINIDSGQFYEPLSIGTAKPDWKNQPIEHHLFDIITNPVDFTVHEYRDIVIKKIKEIQAKGKLPILVGGSGFYIQSLFFPPQAVTINKPRAQQELNSWQKLYEIDPVRANAIQKNDTYRIDRALDIWRTTGQKPSEYIPEYSPEFDFEIVIVTRDRERLYQRINDRVEQMFAQGWFNEVSSLNSNWKQFLKAKKLIGYDDILRYSESESSDYDALVETIKQKSRNYAKRQLTFFRMLTKKIIKSELDSNQPIRAQKISWNYLSHKL